MEMKAISLQSGKTIQGNKKSIHKPEMISDEIAINIPEEEEETPATTATQPPTTRNPTNTNFVLTIEEIKNHARIPYPLAVKKKGLSNEFERFVEIIKKQEVTLTFLEAFTKIPAYAKFLKDVLNKKINLSDPTEVSIYEEDATI